MRGFLWKTFGGLTVSYFLRQLMFGVALLAFYVWLVTRGEKPVPIHFWIFVTVSTVLYPYSRFVYESVVGFVLGNTVVIANGPVFIFAKLITMVLCWSMASFIAPVGLIYLYFYHTKLEQKASAVESTE